MHQGARALDRVDGQREVSRTSSGLVAVPKTSGQLPLLLPQGHGLESGGGRGQDQPEGADLLAGLSRSLLHQYGGGSDSKSNSETCLGKLFGKF